jgi:hypothetical protein
MENKINALPQYWVVENDGSRLFQEEVMQYLNLLACAPCWVYETWKYAGCDGNSNMAGTNCYDNLDRFSNNPTLLTIGEFIRLKNTVVEHFVLPENWYVTITEENKADVKEWYINAYGNRFAFFSIGAHYGITEGRVNGYGCDDVEPEWTEITTEQFRKHILKKDIKMQKIKYYKLVKKEYLNAAKILAGSEVDFQYIPPDSNAIYNLRKAGVLNTWFEAIMEEEYKIITMGTSKVPIKISKKGIEADGKIYTIQEILELKKKFESIAIGYRSVDVETFKIGCSKFSKEELELAIKTYYTF